MVGSHVAINFWYKVEGSAKASLSSSRPFPVASLYCWASDQRKAPCDVNYLLANCRLYDQCILIVV